MSLLLPIQPGLLRSGKACLWRILVPFNGETHVLDKPVLVAFELPHDESRAQITQWERRGALPVVWDAAYSWKEEVDKDGDTWLHVRGQLPRVMSIKLDSVRIHPRLGLPVNIG